MRPSEADQLRPGSGSVQASLDRGQGTSIHERFSVIAGRHARDVAVVDGARSLTYGELDARSEELASALRAVSRGSQLVALRLERSVDIPVGVLAVLKSGCGYVPIDAGHPTARQETILAETAVDHVISDRGGVAGERVVEWFGSLCLLERSSAEARPKVPDNVAYVIYTSGSTGVPKGCMVTHRNVISLMEGVDEVFAITASDVWSLFHSISFDFSVWEMWGALLFGGVLVVLPTDVILDADALVAWARDRRITVLSLVPSAFTNLQRFAQAMPEGLEALRYVVFGGEPLQARPVVEWMETAVNPNLRFVNMYGITETTVHVTFCNLDRDTLGATPRPNCTPIGRPLPNSRLVLATEHGRVVDAGEVGEILVFGSGVTAGYLARPDLTDAKFIRDDDGAVVGYRSGDWAFQSNDGNYFSVGRRDRQVKLRGFRIELGEVEARVATFPEVRVAACVVESRGPRGAEILTCFIESRREFDAVLFRAVREHVSQVLPDYMVPGRFRQVRALPVTANGKLDTKQLQAAVAAGHTDAND